MPNPNRQQAAEDDMVEMKVTVSGPGDTLWGVMNTIQKALQEAGVSVVVEDDYPPADNRGAEEYSKKPNVLLLAEHLPWGG